MVLVEVVSHLPQQLLIRLRVVPLDVVDLILKGFDLHLDDFGEDDRLAVDTLPLAVVVKGILGQERAHLALLAVDSAHVGAQLRGIGTPAHQVIAL